MRVPGRRAGGRRLQTRSSLRQGCMEDKAQGHIPHRRDHAHYGCPEDRRGKGYRWAERGIQVPKEHDQGREQHKAIAIL